MTLIQKIRDRMALAADQLGFPVAEVAASVRPCGDPAHGHYQANAAMALGKKLGKPPRDVATQLAASVPQDGFLQAPEVAGPGFLNLRLTDDAIAFHLEKMAKSPDLGLEQPEKKRRLVIDFSSPNVAKPMHVGHLRSTILGDALARLFRTLGHEVVTLNHLGDWGAQFGILLYGYKNLLDQVAFKTDPVKELARLYVEVRKHFAVDEEEEGEAGDPVRDACRQETAKLHQGDVENLRLWREFMPFCLEDINRAYRRLGVTFDHIRGESFYQPFLAEVAAELEQAKIAEPSQGALVVLFGENEAPALIRKRDGAFTYATTDLAAVRHRTDNFQPTDIVYVVDSRQAQHFKQVFEIARRWGIQGPRLHHVAFGSVLGSDGKPIKTRDGKASTTLEGLLDEAVRLAGTMHAPPEGGEGETPITPEEAAQVAEAVGIGAVKYADLSQNRTTDYKFNWDKMLAMDGNTATYMQYAYARCRSILRKAGHPDGVPEAKIILGAPEEKFLGVVLLRYAEALESAAEDFRPNVLTAYLWDLAKAYSVFFQNCTVLRAPDEVTQHSRLAMCALTARVLKSVLEILGIRVLERM
ncbi:MAG: arginine--tRNA ligase [Gemmataceae bacterium]|jgi:arginyl-tRNA synthetase|nr:arginine--tRNA ligase [Gemmataceae bacterium]